MHDSNSDAPCGRPAAALAGALGAHAEQVCRRYLARGRKQGRYWMVGDVHGTPGRSLYVRLAPPGAPGRWTDAATGERGDLLELLRLHLRAPTLGPALAEARAFLGQAGGAPPSPPARCVRRDEAPRKMWAMSRAIDASHAEAYLRARGIRACRDAALRFHPELYYRDANGKFSTYPALVARVTGPQDLFTGIQRTYLHPKHAAKARVPDPRKALGHIHGHAVRLGPSPDGTLAVAEGIETALSLRTARPSLAVAATLGAAGLGAFVPPPGLARLLIACDNDPAGDAAAERLCERCRALGLDVDVLLPMRNDFNDDLLDDGPAALGARIDAVLRR